VGQERRRTRRLALDAGALIALETPRGRALVRELTKASVPLIVSAGALAQAWRAPVRQALLGALLGRADTLVVALDKPAARACGVLLARTGTADVVDAHVVLSAREHDAAGIVTSDAGDLGLLDPRAALHPI